MLLKSGVINPHTLSEVVDDRNWVNTHVAFSDGGHFIAAYCLYSVVLNLSLFFFNLIPIGPLDGHWLVGSMLQPVQRNQWLRFCHGPGMYIFIALIMIRSETFHPLQDYMSFTVNKAFNFMLGGAI